MFSGRVSSGTWPRMTMRSKQWYTKASRLPNNRTKSSIGPLAPLRFVSQQKHRTGDRWRSKKFQIFLLRTREAAPFGNDHDATGKDPGPRWARVVLSAQKRAHPIRNPALDNPVLSAWEQFKATIVFDAFTAS